MMEKHQQERPEAEDIELRPVETDGYAVIQGIGDGMRGGLWRAHARIVRGAMKLARGFSGGREYDGILRSGQQ